MELIALVALFAAAARTADAQLATEEELLRTIGEQTSQNCFAKVGEDEWPLERVLRFNASEAAVVFDVGAAGDGLRECLEGDGGDRDYRIVVLRDGHVFREAPLETANSTAAVVTFAYAVLPGEYSARVECGGCSEEATSSPVGVVGEDCDAVRVPASVAVEQQGRTVE